MISKVLPAIVCTIALGGCANSIKPQDLPQQRIVDVQVTSNDTVRAQSDIASKVAISGRAAAAAYNAYMPANAPGRIVKINIDQVHYKNPLASFLVGDAHRIKGVVAGGVSQPSSIMYVDAGSGAINGIAGAVIAAATDKSRVDSRLAAGLAGKALAKAYGQKSVPTFVSKHMSGKPVHYEPATTPSVQPHEVPDNRYMPTVEETPTEHIVMAEQSQPTPTKGYTGPTPPKAASN